MIYKGSDLERLLGVKESTIRKYCVLMQESGYKFRVLPNSTRIYTEKDLNVFREIIAQKNQKGIKLEEAIQIVISDITDTTDTKNSDITDISTTTDIELWNSFQSKLTQEIAAATERIEQSNKQLKLEMKQEIVGEYENHISKLQDYIDNSLKKRDELLVKSIKQSLEERQNRGFFYHLKSLFSKK